MVTFLMHRRYTKLVSLLTLVLSAGFLLFCGDSYNPFTDLSNARTVITRKSFGDRTSGDSVSVFSPESLWFVIGLREEVDSVVFEAPSSHLGERIVFRSNDRSWKKADTRIATFSLSRPGDIVLSLRTYRKDGQIATEHMELKVFSPLRPTVISGFQGKEITLVSAAVQDQAALYNWKFSENLVLSVLSPQTDTSLQGLRTTSGKGTLWLSDLRGNYNTPGVPFTYAFSDTAGPEIHLNTPSDSIETGDSVYTVEVRVRDQGVGYIERVELDGTTMHPGISISTYHLPLDIPSTSAFTRHTIVAFDEQGNATTKHFWIRYNPALEEQGSMRMSLFSPPSDTHQVASDHAFFLGILEDYASDTIMADILLKREASRAESIYVSGAQSALWKCSLQVKSPRENIEISATDRVNGHVRTKTITILRDSTSSDSHAPIIANMSIDGMPADRYRSRSDSVLVRIVAFDEQSGIRTLTLDGHPAVQDERKGFLWYASAENLQHTKDGNILLVETEDSSGNYASRQAKVFFNSPPRVVQELKTDRALLSGLTYTDTLGIVDPDFDSVSILISRSPEDLSISGKTVTWTPAVSDIGLNELSLYLWDGYERTPYTAVFEVARAENTPCSLSVRSFHLTTSGDSLWLDTLHRDTLRFTIHDNDHPQLDTYRLQARHGTTNISKDLDTARSFTIILDPNASHFSSGPLTVTVADRADHRDSLIIFVPHRRVPQRLGLYRLAFADHVFTTPINRPLLGFPLLVRLDSTFDFSRSGRIAFTKNDGTELAYEIERWDPQNRKAEIWLSVDTLVSEGFTQQIWLDIDTTRSFSFGSPTAVFDTSHGFRLVYHLDSAATGTGNQGVYRNSAMDAFHGTDDISDTGKKGIIAQGQGFDGSNDRIEIGSPDFPGTQMTISCWLKPLSFDIAGRMISKTTSGSNSDHHWMLSLKDQSLRSRLRINGTTYVMYSEPSDLNSGRWMYGVVSYDGRTMRIYKYDGSPDDGLSNSEERPGAIDSGSSIPVAIGNNSAGNGARPLDGSLDEIRVSTRCRSPEWIRLCYVTQHPDKQAVHLITVP